MDLAKNVLGVFSRGHPADDAGLVLFDAIV
jgi:hypothetical protein